MELPGEIDRETDEENLLGSSRTSRAKVYAGRVGNTIRVNDLNEARNGKGTETLRRTGSKLIPLRLMFIRRPGVISRMQKFVYRTEKPRPRIEETLVRFIAR